MTDAPRPLPEPLNPLRWITLLSLWVLWLTLWTLWLVYWVLASIVGRLRQLFVPGRVQIAVLLTLALLLTLAAWVLVPVGWGWLELHESAQHLARRADDRDDDAIRLELKRLAFRKGFVEILDAPEAIQIERFEGLEGPRCRIRLHLDHRLRWRKPLGPVIPIRIQAERSVVPTVPPTSGEGHALELLR